MPRTARSTEAGMVYHVLNRGNGRMRIFHKAGDFEAFEHVLAEGLQRYPVELFTTTVAAEATSTKGGSRVFPSPRTTTSSCCAGTRRPMPCEPGWWNGRRSGNGAACGAGRMDRPTFR
jgi:hypothetical protein